MLFGTILVIILALIGEGKAMDRNALDPGPQFGVDYTYGPFGERYDIQNVPTPNVLAVVGRSPPVMAARAVAAASRGPWSPAPPRAQTPRREAKLDGDDGVGQHVYEAILGRTRRPGDAVAQPGSGWWMIGGQPIPKPTNPLPLAVGGGVGYGVYQAMGGPELYEQAFGAPQHPLDHGWQNLWNDLRDLPSSYTNYRSGLGAAQRLGIYRPGDPSQSSEEKDRIRDVILQRDLPIYEGRNGEQY